MRPNLDFPADLVTSTEEILSGKIHFLCSVSLFKSINNFFSLLTSTH